MTLFEIIILFLIYIFCLGFSFAFSFEILMETKSSMFGRFLLFLDMLVIAPILSILVIGVYVAKVINESLGK